jgi:hypothetical protein
LNGRYVDQLRSTIEQAAKSEKLIELCLDPFSGFRFPFSGFRPKFEEARTREQLI